MLVLHEFAYVGGYVPNNTFVSVALGGLTATPAVLSVRSVVGLITQGVPGNPHDPLARHRGGPLGPSPDRDSAI